MNRQLWPEPLTGAACVPDEGFREWALQQTSNSDGGPVVGSMLNLIASVPILVLR